MLLELVQVCTRLVESLWVGCFALSKALLGVDLSSPPTSNLSE